MRAVSKIDHALKTLYQLTHRLQAKDFLVKISQSSESKVSNRLGKGSLLISQPKVDDLEIAIYLHPKILDVLSHFSKWPRSEWTFEQFEAFTVAVEEISHFNYLVERAQKNQSVSGWELELQSEIDRFVIAFMVQKHQRKLPSFDELFERHFSNFTWDASISKQDLARYEDAHRFAKNWVAKLRPAFQHPKKWPWLVNQLRTFYHAPREEKARLAQS